MVGNLQPASAVEAASAELQYYHHQRVKTPSHHLIVSETLYQFGKMSYVCISLTSLLEG